MSKVSLKYRAVTLGLSFVVASLGGVVAVYTSGDNLVRVEDRCDPATFNAALNDPNACVHDGGTTFDQFLANTAAEGGDHHWRFKEDDVQVRTGEAVRVVNQGGETHTFTPVAEFGGGFIDVLNNLSGAGATVPECVPGAAGQNPVPADHTLMFTPKAGTHVQKVQCCIHPWMHTEITVRNR